MGPLKKVSLAFDAQGKSKGTAEVVFVRKQDAISSVKKYNNVALDG
jgi:THO complex subunit 4